MQDSNRARSVGSKQFTFAQKKELKENIEREIRFERSRPGVFQIEVRFSKYQTEEQLHYGEDGL
jgi:hypothetical protein